MSSGGGTSMLGGCGGPGGEPSGSGSSRGGPGGGGGRPCGACKFLRRKCLNGCIFAPYFDSEQGAADFAPVHKVFGASNVSKLLLEIPEHKRLDAVDTICYEARARLRDPIYGCVAHIVALQQQVVNLQAKLTYMQTHLAALELPWPPLPVAAQMPMAMPAQLSISDLPSSTNIPSTIDLPALFDPPAQPQWVLQQHHQHLHHQPSYGPPAPRAPSAMPEGWAGGGGDLHALARELLDCHGRFGVKPQLPPPYPR